LFTRLLADVVVGRLVRSSAFPRFTPHRFPTVTTPHGCPGCTPQTPLPHTGLVWPRLHVYTHCHPLPTQLVDTLHTFWYSSQVTLHFSLRFATWFHLPTDFTELVWFPTGLVPTFYPTHHHTRFTRDPTAYVGVLVPILHGLLWLHRYPTHCLFPHHYTHGFTVYTHATLFPVCHAHWVRTRYHTGLPHAFGCARRTKLTPHTTAPTPHFAVTPLPLTTGALPTFTRGLRLHTHHTRTRLPRSLRAPTTTTCTRVARLPRTCRCRAPCARAHTVAPHACLPVLPTRRAGRLPRFCPRAPPRYLPHTRFTLQKGTTCGSGCTTPPRSVFTCTHTLAAVTTFACWFGLRATAHTHTCTALAHTHTHTHHTFHTHTHAWFLPLVWVGLRFAFPTCLCPLDRKDPRLGLPFAVCSTHCGWVAQHLVLDIHTFGLVGFWIYICVWICSLFCWTFGLDCYVVPFTFDFIHTLVWFCCCVTFALFGSRLLPLRFPHPTTTTTLCCCCLGCLHFTRPALAPTPHLHRATPPPHTTLHTFTAHAPRFLYICGYCAGYRTLRTRTLVAACLPTGLVLPDGTSLVGLLFGLVTN